MTLVREQENSYITEEGSKERALKQRMEHHYRSSITLLQEFWVEGDLDSRFRAGDGQLYSDIYGGAAYFRKRNFNFNRIRRICNMISGYQRRNRKSTVVQPVEGDDNETASQLTKVLFWAMKKESFLEKISTAFDRTLTTGMTLLSPWMDYREDPVSGDLRLDLFSYNSFLIDPFFKNHDLSDCDFIWTRKYMTKRELASLLPERADEIMNMTPSGNKDGKFEFMPESYDYGSSDLLYMDQFWYMEPREEEILIDQETGESISLEELKKSVEDLGGQLDLKKMLRQNPRLVKADITVPSCRLGIAVQGKVMYDGPNPMGTDRYPFAVVLGYYEPQIPYFPLRVQGVVRGLRDSQFLYNRRKIIELDILESQITSGFKYKEDALVNPEDVFLSGQGKGLALKSEALMSDVEQIQPPQVPPSMVQLSQILGEEIQQISGVNEELLGSAEDDKSGILSMLRQGAGLTTLQILFDQLDASQKFLGQVCLEMIQSNFVASKVRRIVGADPSPSFSSGAFAKFDAYVEEGVNTSSQRQLQLKQLLALREVGIPVPMKVILDSVTVQDKQELIKAIEEEEKRGAEEAQKQAELQQAQIQAEIKLANARATADEGLGIERMSRIQENLSLAEERKSESAKDRAKAVLDIAKTAKELEGMDLDNLRKTLTLLSNLE